MKHLFSFSIVSLKDRILSLLFIKSFNLFLSYHYSCLFSSSHHYSIDPMFKITKLFNFSPFYYYFRLVSFFFFVFFYSFFPILVLFLPSFFFFIVFLVFFYFYFYPFVIVFINHHKIPNISLRFFLML